MARSLLLALTLLAVATPVAFAAIDLDPVPAPAAMFPYPGWKGAKGPANRQGRVEVIRQVGGAVYVGGDLTHALDVDKKLLERNGLAAIDPKTGRLTSFAPKLDGRVFALAATADGKTLFVGGEFSHADGQPFSRLVAYDLTSGTVSPVLADSKVSGEVVKTLWCQGDALFIGGRFSSVCGQPRHNLAKLTRSASGSWALADWAPQAGGDKSGAKVMALGWDRSANRLIAGGYFLTVNGKPTKRLAALDPEMGESKVQFELLPPEKSGKPFAYSEVIDLSVHDTSLYIAMGGPGGTALAYDLTNGKLKWFYHTDGNVQAAAFINGYAVFGHHGDFVAKEPNHYIKEYAPNTGDRVSRKKLFVCDPQTGKLQDWAPRFERSDPKYSPLGIWAFEVADNSLFVGGDFTLIGNHPAERFAIFRGAVQGK